MHGRHLKAEMIRAVLFSQNGNICPRPHAAGKLGARRRSALAGRTDRSASWPVSLTAERVDHAIKVLQRPVLDQDPSLPLLVTNCDTHSQCALQLFFGG